MVQVLLEAGADKNVAKQDGATALMAAAQNGHLKVVRVLLEAGADKNAAKQNGATALMMAAVNGYTWKWCGCCSRPELTRMLQGKTGQPP